MQEGSTGAQSISREEVQQCMRNVPDAFSVARLRLDLGPFFEEGTAERVAQCVPKKLLRLLHVPGVCSRLDEFLRWLALVEGDAERWEEMDALWAFARHLGRVVSYRALSLTVEQYESVRRAQCIFSRGRLRVSDAVLNDVVSANGVYSICLHRLYISRMRWPDPSVSLHDDPETALIIAGGYFEQGRKVYLFECDVPKIWCVGWSVWDVQDEKEVWFEHRDCWFNSTWERTERYLLYGVPLDGNVLRNVREFDSEEQIVEFVQPFVKRQLEKKLADD